MAWLFLFTAGVAEIVFAVSLKFNEGFTRLIPSIITGVAGTTSFYLLTLAMRGLPLGTAYAIWTGMGAVGVALVGIFYFKESADWLRIASLLLVVVGILGLKFSHSE